MSQTSTPSLQERIAQFDAHEDVKRVKEAIAKSMSRIQETEARFKVASTKAQNIHMEIVKERLNLRELENSYNQGRQRVIEDYEKQVQAVQTDVKKEATDLSKAKTDLEKELARLRQEHDDLKQVSQKHYERARFMEDLLQDARRENEGLNAKMGNVAVSVSSQ